MQWDIDKALTEYNAPGVLLEKSVTMVVMDQALWKQHGLRPNVDPTQQSVIAWCLSIGRYNGPKMLTYALTIREAHLKMRRFIKELDVDGALLYGVKGKPKRKKFERREKKPRVKDESPAPKPKKAGKR